MLDGTVTVSLNYVAAIVVVLATTISVLFWQIVRIYHIMLDGKDKAIKELSKDIDRCDLRVDDMIKEVERLNKQIQEIYDEVISKYIQRTTSNNQGGVRSRQS